MFVLKLFIIVKTLLINLIFIFINVINELANMCILKKAGVLLQVIFKFISLVKKEVVFVVREEVKEKFFELDI